MGTDRVGKSYRDEPPSKLLSNSEASLETDGMIDQSERAKDAMRKSGYTRELPGA